MTSPEQTSRQVVFPENFGFCGGVAAADSYMGTVAAAAKKFGVQVLGFHGIVHNKDVLEKHEDSGVRFVDDISVVEPGNAVVISAHGASPEVFHAIQQRGAEVFDATCPLVTQTHRAAWIAREQDEKIIYVCHGKPGEVDNLHDEVAGMVGHLDFTTDDSGRLLKYAPLPRTYLELGEDIATSPHLLTDNRRYRLVTQTTLNAHECQDYIKAIKASILDRQPDARVEWSNHGGVCHAVADRQAGVKSLVASRPDVLVVVTDPASKNGMGYFRLAQELVNESGQQTRVMAVAGADELRIPDIADLDLIGVTASASTPQETINELSRRLNGDAAPVSLDSKAFILKGATETVIYRRMAALALQSNDSGSNESNETSA